MKKKANQTVSVTQSKSETNDSLVAEIQAPSAALEAARNSSIVRIHDRASHTLPLQVQDTDFQKNRTRDGKLLGNNNNFSSFHNFSFILFSKSTPPSTAKNSNLNLDLATEPNVKPREE